MLRIPYADLESALHTAMLALGLKGDRALRCARLFAETTRDGVYTHGLNRFSRFTQLVNDGLIDVDATPERVSGTAVLERWDGHRGPGNLNAEAAMGRAIELAKHFGMGAVALANTSHWMRAGTYGWQAADAGVFGICWTNTMPNLPAWGATTPVVGNNPLVFAAPRFVEGRSEPIVLDMAMSQFSYGTLAAYARRGQPLPIPGGYDTAGNLTTDAAAIEASQRALPVGYWKGSGLAMMLDLFAASLSGGIATHQLAPDAAREAGIAQFFLALDPNLLAPDPAAQAAIAQNIVASLQTATPIDPSRPVRYPGEQTLRLREENLRLGVPVEEDVWRKLLADFPAPSPKP